MKKVIDLKSQSFIHQVRILSAIFHAPGIQRDVRSQSFIHQVRILSKPIAEGKPLLRACCRNPLFIKSEFSPGDTRSGRICPDRVVAILYSSSQNSLQPLREALPTSRMTSQSFIHQVRILSGYIVTTVLLWR